MSKKYLIWSNEHRMWWKPNSFGYTPHISDAGIFSKEKASEIVAQATQWLDTAVPQELAVDIETLPKGMKIGDTRVWNTKY